jgi:hypothetical protein
MPLFPSSKSRVETKVYFVHIKARNGSDALQLQSMKWKWKWMVKQSTKGATNVKASSQVKPSQMSRFTRFDIDSLFYSILPLNSQVAL